jgi:hypothetical protein
MSQKANLDSAAAQPPPLDLSKWRNLPVQLVGAGAVVGLLGLVLSLKSGGTPFLVAYLVAFMFTLSLGAGSLFLVMVHHLFDAGWSVPIRRFCEHLACAAFTLLPFLFLPIAIGAPKIYPWMQMLAKHQEDHALHAKWPLLTHPGLYLVAVICFVSWWLLANRLRYWSLKQDETGAAECTYKMRVLSCTGIFIYAFTLTFGAIMWMKTLQHQWFSTMFGVHYFAGSVWLTLATVYVITMVLDRQKILTDVLHEHQYYFLGTLMFAFTVFYAYVTFSQYFIIWNANMPEETFYYVIREKGTWFWASMVIIFGHFFLPFLALLRIDVKSNFAIMVPIAIWAWLMHFVDMTWNVMPEHFKAGFPFGWALIALGLVAFMVGLLAILFLKNFNRTAPFPIKDPRLIEAMGLYHPVPTQISGGELDQADNLHGAPTQPKGSH